MAEVDVVIVSYNSHKHLRQCITGALSYPGANVIVVDNASSDGSVDAIADLSVMTVALESNRGFAHGCNVGYRRGRAPNVLLLNPDAMIDAASLSVLVRSLDSAPRIGAVAPRLLHQDGSLEVSQRRFPRTTIVLAQAFFLHRLFPRARWVDDVVRDPSLYEDEQSAEWLPAACLLIRRDLLERIDGLDEEFFHYCEDMDLCRRIRDLSFDIRYKPSATAIHIGGQSAPRAALLPRLTASKIRYASKHRSFLGKCTERLALAIYALTHAAVPATGGAVRKGHREAFAVAIRGGLPTDSSWPDG